MGTTETTTYRRGLCTYRFELATAVGALTGPVVKERPKRDQWVDPRASIRW